MSMNSRKADIVIVSTQSFPYGEAATNRIISYAKVLAEDLKVKYISITPDFLCNPSNLSKGEYEGIEYEYAPGTSKWNSDWPKWKKAIHIYKGRINIFRLLRKHDPTTVILVTRDISLTKRFIDFSIRRKVRLILERTELANIKDAKDIGKLFSLYSRLSGIMCISSEIISYLQPISDSVRLFHLPMSVDIKRFNKRNIATNYKKYFAMCSGNNWERDGAIDSINAFLEFRETHPEYQLKIAGLLNDKTEYNRRFKQIVESNQNNGVIYMGRLASDNIPDFIMEATAVLMTPHKDYESGGFPTKLGEYLASGVPVICTSVSEIPNYLNCNNSYICRPNDKQAMVVSMKEIVENKAHAHKVGQEGRKVANTVFNVATYKNELIQFLLNDDN